jgi:hypothetical protein
MPDLGDWYIVFSVLVIVGSANAVNLTDGLDGLAIGPVLIASATFMLFCYLAGNFRFAGYLQIPFVKGSGELTILCGIDDSMTGPATKEDVEHEAVALLSGKGSWRDLFNVIGECGQGWGAVANALSESLDTAGR